MKLLKAHIKRYGSLENRDFVFEDGINCFLEGNGQGKSTLASFLKAMLYGLDTIRTGGKGFIDRVHYCPFGATDFGGWLELSEDGHHYRIERTFHSKSATKDVSEIRKDGRSFSLDEKKEIGDVLLGVDEGTFLRTAYLSGNELSLDASEGIINALTKQLHGDEDFGQYQKAEEKLRQLRSAIRGDRKSPNDELSKAEERIASLKEKRLGALNEAAEAEGILRALEGVRKEQADVDLALASANAEAMRSAAWNKLRITAESADAQKKKIEEASSKYQGKLPKKEELDEIGKRIKELNELNEQAKRACLSQAESEELSHLKTLFLDGTISEDALDEVKKRGEDEIGFAKQYLDGSGAFKPEYQALDAKFSKRELKEEEIKALTVYAVTMGGKPEEPTPAAQEVDKPKRYLSPLTAVLAALGAIAFIGGIVLLFLVSLILGVVVLGIGVCVLFGALYAHFQGKAKKAEAASQGRSFAISPEVASIYFAFDLSIGDSPKPLLHEYEAYLKLKEDKAIHQENRKYLDDIFAKYKIPEGSDYARIQSLESKNKRYIHLLEEEAQCKVVQEEIAKKRKPLEEALAAFIKKHEIQEDSFATWLDEAETDLRNISLWENERKRYLSEAETIKKESKLEGEPPLETAKADTDSLSARQSELAQEAADLRAKIEKCSQAEERAKAIEGELKKAEGEKDALDRKRDLYRITRECLANAHDKLVEKYLKPLSASFEKYALPLKEAIGYDVAFSVSGEGNPLEISISNRSHSNIDYRHLSLGQLSLVCLCFRLALAEQMYQGKKPFYLLDDPFAMLDDENVKKAARLLEEVADGHQIVYFTCAGNRRI